jgi:tetratricopeptide (TPR) repeat protein
LFNALVEAASENIGSPNEEIEAFDQAIKLGDELERDYANDARFKEQRVRAYLNKAILLEGDGHLEQAFPCFVTAEELSSNGTSEELQTIHSRALMGLARSYDHLDKPIEEISTYELLVSRFKDSPIQSIKRRVVNAMFNRALTLESVGRDVEVIPAYNAVLEYIGTDHDENFQRVWCQSMLNKIIKLQTTGKREEALPLADEVIDRYSSSRVVDVLEQVARVMLVKGYNLHQLGRIDDALATFETLSSRFAEVPSDDIQERVKLANESIGKIRDVPKTDELGD